MGFHILICYHKESCLLDFVFQLYTACLPLYCHRCKNLHRYVVLNSNNFTTQLEGNEPVTTTWSGPWDRIRIIPGRGERKGKGLQDWGRMFKNREGTGRRKLCCEQGWWGTAIGQGRRHSPYICSAPMREKPVRPRGGYVTVLRANMFLGKQKRTSKKRVRDQLWKKKERNYHCQVSDDKKKID